MLKPFIKKELQEQIFFHSSHEDLYDIVSKESLPNDFGGEIGSVKDLYEAQLKWNENNFHTLKEFDKFRVSKS